MRKHRKLAAVLSTTAVLTAFAPLFTTPVLAQSVGWVQENENWSYYDLSLIHISEPTRH